MGFLKEKILGKGESALTEIMLGRQRSRVAHNKLKLQTSWAFNCNCVSSVNMRMFGTTIAHHGSETRH